MTNQDTTRSICGLREIEAEALIRFAVEFLYRVMGSAKADKVQAAYDQTLPDAFEFEGVAEYMAGLVWDRARFMFADEFRQWALREILPLQEAAEALALQEAAELAEAEALAAYRVAKEAGTLTRVPQAEVRRRLGLEAPKIAPNIHNEHAVVNPCDSEQDYRDDQS